MKQFKKYCSIDPSYNADYIEKVRQKMGKDALFVCQEKVDGSNFSFIVGRNENGEIEVSCGKRSSELGPDEYFSGYQRLQTALEPNIKPIFEFLETKYDCSNGVNIFGEICGGYYKGLKSEESSILGRVSYSPKHEFYGFDIYIPNIGYLPPIESIEILNKFGIFSAENLFIGTLDECLKLDTVFLSTIGKRLGYPEVPDNFAEGYVIKPIVPTYFNNGERVIIKHKNPKFVEVCHKKEKTEIVFSSELEGLLNRVQDYVNENRLMNVISHIGEVSFPKDISTVMKEFSNDILKEFIYAIPDNMTMFHSLPKDEQKKFMQNVGKMCVNIIKEKYMS